MFDFKNTRSPGAPSGFGGISPATKQSIVDRFAKVRGNVARARENHASTPGAAHSSPGGFDNFFSSFGTSDGTRRKGKTGLQI